MAFLADLCNPEHRCSGFQHAADRQAFQVDSFHQQVLSEIAVRNAAALSVEFRNAVPGQQADLPVPLSRVRVVLDPEIPDQDGMIRRAFHRSLFRADADRPDYSLKFHGRPPFSAFGLMNVPLFPPRFSTSMICPISIVLSTALHIS